MSVLLFGLTFCEMMIVDGSWFLKNFSHSKLKRCYGSLKSKSLGTTDPAQPPIQCRSRCSIPNRWPSNFYFDNSEEGGFIDFTKQPFWFWRAFIFWSKIKLKSNTLPIHLPSSVWSKQNAFTVRCLALQIFEASHHVPCKRFPGFLPPLCLCSSSVASFFTLHLLLVTFILPVSLLESVLPRGTLASAVGGRVLRAQPAASLVLASDCRLRK